MLPEDPAALAFCPHAKRQSGWILIKWNIFRHANQPGSAKFLAFGMCYWVMSDIHTYTHWHLQGMRWAQPSSETKSPSHSPDPVIGSPELPQMHLVFATGGMDRLLGTKWISIHFFTPGNTICEHWVGCHVLLQCMKMKSESEVAQSCPTLSDPMDCRLLGTSFHGIFQARVLE